MKRRVLIDALAARYGGTAYAAVHLARELVTSGNVDAVYVAARNGSIVQQGLEDDAAVSRISLPAARRFELLHRVIWEGAWLPRLARREGIDLVITMSGMLPRDPGCAVMCLLFNPVMYEHRTPANLLRRHAVRRTARRANHIAAPSKMMADLAAASIGRDCAVVPLGVDHEVFAPGEAVGEEILCVADFYEHKRHDIVLDAWLRLASPRPHLRLIGEPSVDTRVYDRLLARIRELPERGSIIVERRLPLAGLVDAYHNARVFVMASTQESFCMPLVESMACGVPAVVRDLPSLRETGGSGAFYVEGDDPGNWAAAIESLRTGSAQYEEARAAASRSAGRFSWSSFAAELERAF